MNFEKPICHSSQFQCCIRQNRRTYSKDIRFSFDQNNINSTCFENIRTKIEILTEKIFHRQAVGSPFRVAILFRIFELISKKRMLKQHCSKKLEYSKNPLKSNGNRRCLRQFFECFRNFSIFFELCHHSSVISRFLRYRILSPPI